jgi:hypothetical protein
VSDHDFLFALELSDEKAFDGMMTELAQAVLGHVGLAKAAIDELARELHGALADGTAAGRRRCDVRFLAHAGELQIFVVYDGGANWQTTRRLP